MLETSGISVETAEAPWFNPPSLARGLAAGWWRSAAFRAARSGEFDLVHLVDHALAHHAHGLRGHLPVLVTCHDLMPFSVEGYYESRLEGVVKRAFLRRSFRALRSAHRVIAVSEFTRGEAIRLAGVNAARVSVVPNVVRPSLAAASGAAPVPVDSLPHPRILSIGNDRGYKNLSALMEALSSPLLAEAHLVRVGAPLSRQVRARAKTLGVDSRVHDLGVLSDGELAAAYRATDVFVQPSLGEGFGLPVIEAMAAGLPAVVSDGGALPNVVGDAGTVVPLGAEFAERLAAAIAAAAHDRAAWTDRSRRRAAEFQPALVAPLLIAAYQQTVGARPDPNRRA
jgi:glycosyltransferase involved in cell wall biosynthesis